MCPSRQSPVTDDGSRSPTARTSTCSSTSSCASRPPLSSACTTLVAWARSRRLRQMEPHSVSSLLLSFLPLSFGRQLPCSSRLVAALPAVVGTLPTTRTARAAVRVDRPNLSRVSVLRHAMPVHLYVLLLPDVAGAVRRDAMRKNNSMKWN